MDPCARGLRGKECRYRDDFPPRCWQSNQGAGVLVKVIVMKKMVGIA
jgi:hypothetical protein